MIQVVDEKIKTIWVNMPRLTANEIEKRAASMSLTTGNYCKVVLTDWINDGKRLKLVEQ